MSQLFTSSELIRTRLACVTVACMAVASPWTASAQQTNTTAQRVIAAEQQQQAGNPTTSANTAARFVQSCNDSLERGVSDLGCQAPIYRNELERLKREAMTTNNPQLLSLVGEAYRNPRNGLGDLGQAYRWYLLAAVRGDPMAMRRLSELNLNGQGVPKDNVKALGYARLADRLAIPGSSEQRSAVATINELGNEMALEEVALAVSFADQLEAQIRRQSGDQPLGATSGSADAPRSAPPVPGMAPAPAPTTPGVGAPTPGTVLPGVPARMTP